MDMQGHRVVDDCIEVSMLLKGQVIKQLLPFEDCSDQEKQSAIEQATALRSAFLIAEQYTAMNVNYHELGIEGLYFVQDPVTQESRWVIDIQGPQGRIFKSLPVTQATMHTMAKYAISLLVEINGGDVNELYQSVIGSHRLTKLIASRNWIRVRTGRANRIGLPNVLTKTRDKQNHLCLEYVGANNKAATFAIRNATLQEDLLVFSKYYANQTNADSEQIFALINQEEVLKSLEEYRVKRESFLAKKYIQSNKYGLPNINVDEETYHGEDLGFRIVIVGKKDVLTYFQVEEATFQADVDKALQFYSKLTGQSMEEINSKFLLEVMRNKQSIYHLRLANKIKRKQELLPEDLRYRYDKDKGRFLHAGLTGKVGKRYFFDGESHQQQLDSAIKDIAAAADMPADELKVKYNLSSTNDVINTGQSGIPQLLYKHTGQLGKYIAIRKGSRGIEKFCFDEHTYEKQLNLAFAYLADLLGTDIDALRLQHNDDYGLKFARQIIPVKRAQKKFSGEIVKTGVAYLYFKYTAPLENLRLHVKYKNKSDKSITLNLATFQSQCDDVINKYAQYYRIKAEIVREAFNYNAGLEIVKVQSLAQFDQAKNDLHGIFRTGIAHLKIIRVHPGCSINLALTGKNAKQIMMTIKAQDVSGGINKVLNTYCRVYGGTRAEWLAQLNVPIIREKLLSAEAVAIKTSNPSKGRANLVGLKYSTYRQMPAREHMTLILELPKKSGKQKFTIRDGFFDEDCEVFLKAYSKIYGGKIEELKAKLNVSFIQDHMIKHRLLHAEWLKSKPVKVQASKLVLKKEKRFGLKYIYLISRKTAKHVSIQICPPSGGAYEYVAIRMTDFEEDCETLLKAYRKHVGGKINELRDMLNTKAIMVKVKEHHTLRKAYLKEKKKR